MVNSKAKSVGTNLPLWAIQKGPKIAIIVAGGSGTRMKNKTPKQFLPLNGLPILMHSVKAFYEADPATQIILVIPKMHVEQWLKLCLKHSLVDVFPNITSGGKTRFESVKNALHGVGGKGLVAVHDGVRPLVSPALINACYKKAAASGNAVPCIPINDSLRQMKGKTNTIIDRNTVVSIQTPQCFDVEVLKKAYRLPYQKEFTDDASVVEASGVKINLIPGELQNIKITYPQDLMLAEALSR